MSRVAPDTRPHFYAEIRPNQSLSLASMVGFFLSLVFVAAVIGICLSLRGAWMVLPFTGLELAIVAAVLIAISRHAQDYEFVLIDEKRVFFVEPELRRWHPSRLFIGSHGRRSGQTEASHATRRRYSSRLAGHCGPLTECLVRMVKHEL